MMLQPIMKGEKSGQGENEAHLKAALLAKPNSALQNQPRKSNITAISLLDLKFLFFFPTFLHSPNALS